MQFAKKKGHIRHRLLAGLFCISLLTADLASAMPVWAKEPVAEEQTQGFDEGGSEETQDSDSENKEETAENPGEDNGVDKVTNPEGEGGENQTQNPDGEKEGDGEENPDDEKGGDSAQNPGGGEEGDGAQNPGDGTDGDGAQNPDEGKEGDDAQNPGDETDGDNTQNPDEGDTETDDPEEEPGAPEEDEAPEEEERDSVSDNSVSENTLEEQEEMRALAVPADAVDSGAYENITWVVDADGKLTVEGTGDFASIGGGSSARPRGPWCTNFNTKSKIKTAEIKVTKMKDASWMFSGCYNLTKISFTGSDTGSVTDMSGMFQGCYKLETVNLGQNFHTGNVTDMSSMFSGCSGLKNADVSGFNTSSVTNMSYMFYGCTNWGDMNLSGWDTGKTTDMRHMFTNCDFRQIVLGGSFTTHNAADMSYMFACNSDPEGYGCLVGQERQNLTGLDLAWLDLSSVTTLHGIFEGCNVRGLDFGRLDTSVTTTLGGLFSTCDLTGVDFSKLRTDTITDMNRMFANSKGDIDLRTLNTEHVTDMSYMFASVGGGGIGGYRQRIYYLTSIDLSGLDTSNVTNMNFMFSNQPKLTSIDLGGLDTSKVVSTDVMFSGCSGLTQIDLSVVDFGNVTTMTTMFGGCSSLQEVKPGNLGTAKLHMIMEEGEKYLPVAELFYGCTSLETLDMSNFNYEYLEDGWSQFAPLYNCEKLTMLYTPYNVKINIAITGGDNYKGDEEWYMADGTKLTDNCLPKNLPYSVLIQKGSKPAVSAARMEVSKKKTLYGCGETIGTDDLTVTYYGADGSVRKLVQSDGQTDGYTTNAASLSTTEPGMQELVVTYTKDGKTLTGKITLTVAHILTAANTTVTLPTAAYTYDGTPKTPEPAAVTYTKPSTNGTGIPVTLTEGTDYTVSYRNNTDACEQPDTDSAAPTVIIKGTGSYSGTVTKTFAIGKAAAPAEETRNVTAAQCAQAQQNRKIDLTGSFRACGKKTGYEITQVVDTDSIFSKTPVTADIKNGVLTYGTNVAEEGKTASIKISVSFRNYKNAELTVKVTMVAKKVVLISGIVMPDSVVYSGTPVSYSGKAAVKAEDGTDITEKVALVYHYSGTMADGTAYPAQGGAPDGSAAEKPPADAGSYRLTISVKDDDPDYAGSEEYPFTITKADAVVRANDMTVLMQAGGGTVSAGQNGVGEYAFGYETAGLLNGDRLTTGPSYTVTTDEEGKDTVTLIDISKTGRYYIHPSKADAGMNYSLTYKPGILTVSEERVAYTVTFDGMGYCDGFRKSGIKSGALLELSDSERMPAAKEKGHVFAGWYRDRTFAKGKEWNFDTDTVQSDLTLYACWLSAAAEDGNGLKLCVQEIPDQFYTGSAQKPAVTVYDSDGKTLLKSGKDYTVKYVNNTNAAAVGEDGKPTAAGGTASVVNPGKANETITDVIGHFSKDCPYVVITGKGNYAETIYRNFMILPAQISAADGNKAESGGTVGQQGDTPLSAGFTLKYTDQLVADGKKEQKPFGSIKYKKAMKAGTDFTVSLGAQEALDGAGNAVPDWKAEGTLDAGKQYTLPAIPKGYSGTFTLTVTGKGNYAGTVRRKVYVSEKQKLMKNATITLGKNQKTFAYTGQDVMLTPGYYDAATKKNYKVTAAGTVSGTAEENANDMFLVKAGKNGKAGGEGLVWGRDYTIDYAGTNRAAGTATMTLTGINGYVGTKSVTFKITGAKFAANTVDVKVYDSAKPGEPQTDAFRASMPYTGKAVTQNKVRLTTKVTKSNPTAKEFNYGEHYTISYKNNVKKGTATMTFTAKPASGYIGSFKKTFRITAQELSKDRLTVAAPGGSGDSSAAVQTGSDGAEAVYGKNGAKLSFVVTNEAGAVLREGTDYTVKYKNNSAVTTAQTAENKRPLMTVTGKGNYAGKVEVFFAVIPASLKTVIADQTVSVSCAQVQRKNGMKFKDFKFKLVEGKKTLSMGETKDYVIDETKCTPEIIQAYADSLAASDASTGADAAGTLPPEPVVKVTGKGGYAERQTADQSVEIPLGKYIYADKLVTANLYVVVSEGSGKNIYTGGQIKPDVAVYYGEKTAVAAAKRDKVKDEATAQGGKYKLTKLAVDTDYTLSYGANIASGKNKGSVTVTGAGKYGGSVTVRFTIEKKSIY